jgi:16S rRNA (guanine527-N7)-methyltransferase
MEQEDHLASLLRNSVEQIGLHLRADQINRFTIYLAQLRAWNRSVNLTSIADDEEIIIKHFVDSLAALRAEKIKNSATLLDIGTGAGFPGIPLTIAREDLAVTLLEPAHKKISFLHFMVGMLRLERIRIFHGTLERFVESSQRETFDYVTTRALKQEILLEHCRSLLNDGGKAILYHSRPLCRSDLRDDWMITTEYDFDLPKQLGRRVVSVLSARREAGTEHDVPRGTSRLAS